MRELRSAVRRGVYRAHAQGAALVRPSHVLIGRRDSDALTPVPATWDLEVSVREHRRNLIERALDAEQGNVSAAAKRLCVSRSTLYKHMSELGIRTTR